MWSEFRLHPDDSAMEPFVLVPPEAMVKVRWESRLRHLRNRRVTLQVRDKPRHDRQARGTSHEHRILEVRAASPSDSTEHTRMRRNSVYKTTGQKKILQVNIMFSDDDQRPSKEILEKAIKRATWGVDLATDLSSPPLKNWPLKSWLRDTDMDTAYQAASHGALSFPANKGRVVTLTLSGQARNYGNSPFACLSDPIRVEVTNTLQSLPYNIDVGSYDMVHLVLPKAWGRACGWAGLGQVGGSAPMFSWTRMLMDDNYHNPADYRVDVEGFATVMFHEIGHNIGFSHSTDTLTDYGDYTGNMGGADPLVYNAPKLWIAGWLDAAELNDQTGEKGCGHNFTAVLTSLYKPGTTSQKVVIIDRSKDLTLKSSHRGGLIDVCEKTEGSLWFVSFRGLSGDDQYLGPGRTKKVYVHYTRNGGGGKTRREFSLDCSDSPWSLRGQ